MAKQMTTEERRRRRFSEAFRKEQAGLIQSGQTTIAQVSRRYQVRANNVSNWVKKYGKPSKHQGLYTVGNAADMDRLGELQKEHQELQVLFSQQQVRLVYLEQLVSIARKELGQDFEKKSAAKS